jgi:hypothetical protein
MKGIIGVGSGSTNICGVNQMAVSGIEVEITETSKVVIKYMRSNGKSIKGILEDMVQRTRGLEVAVGIVNSVLDIVVYPPRNIVKTKSLGHLVEVESSSKVFITDGEEAVEFMLTRPPFPVERVAVPNRIPGDIAVDVRGTNPP